MPLLKGQAYIPGDLFPPSIRGAKEVWYLRLTGELFTNYEAYINRLRLYNEHIWSCSKTGKTGLTYIQAVNSETRHKTIEDVPKLPVIKPTELQIKLSTTPAPERIDPDLQLLKRYLRNEARSYIANAVTPEVAEGVLSPESENKTSDSKKKRSSSHSKKENEQSKSDAKKIPGTVKHTIYETLKWVGPHGASIAYLQQRLKDCNIRTTWAENSARNCIASLLSHDKAFVKLPKHGHYALALYVKTDTAHEGTEKRELPISEGEVSSYPRNNGRCMSCLKAKHPDNSPLILCDQCPSAVHVACALEHEAMTFDENGPQPEQEKQKGMKFPYLCYKCVDKKKLAERQKAIRQKREVDKLKRKEEKTLRQIEHAEKKKDAEKHSSDKQKAPSESKKHIKFPIEDLELTDEDHGNRDNLKQGPVVPDTHADSEMLLDVLCITEFITSFASELDDKSNIHDLTVAELMYCLNWPFDSPLIKNLYLPLIKTIIKLKMAGSEALVEARRWNAVVDSWTWPELVKLFLQSQEESELLTFISKDLGIEGNEEPKLYLELSPRTHLKILGYLVNSVSSSTMIRQTTDYRLAEARKLESEIFKMKREVNKSSTNKSGTTTTTKTTTTAAAAAAAATATTANQDEQVESELSGKRKLRKRGEKEESPEVIVQNKLAELEEQLEKCKIRCEPLGQDRFYNSYFWFPSFPDCLCIINSGKDEIRCLRSKEGLDAIMAGLSTKGVREKQLLQALKDEYDNLVVCLMEKEFPFLLEEIPRGIQCTELELFYKTNKKQSRMTNEKLKEEYNALGVRTMITRVQKLIGSLSTIDSDTFTNIKNLRFQITCISDLKSLFTMLMELNERIKRIFENGNEKQNGGKNHHRLMTHLDSLEHTPLSISHIALFINTLRDNVEPLIRTKSSKQPMNVMESKRKRTEKEYEEKLSTSSTDINLLPQQKKQKQKEEHSTADVLAFVAVPGRITRSRARTQHHVQEVESSEEESESKTASEDDDHPTDQDYEVENQSDSSQGDSDDEAHDTNGTVNHGLHDDDDDALCKVCNFGGRLIHCQGKGCEMSVHRGCLFGGNSRPIEHPWYCSKCSRVNRALQRKDKKLY